MKSKALTIICLSIMAICLGLFIYAGIRAGIYLCAEYKARKEYDALSQLKDTAYRDENDDEKQREELFEIYKEIYEKNQDFIGWIEIEGTNIDYPVMQTKEQPEYYLNRNFAGEYSAHGVPFLDAVCDIGESNNLIIYGHHMDSETMFHEITYYKDSEFMKGHPVIKFNTMYEIGEYEVVASFCWDAEGDTFRFNQYTEMDMNRYAEFMRQVHKREYFDSGKDALYGEDLLTLVTCDYTYGNGRFVVVAKKVS